MIAPRPRVLALIPSAGRGGGIEAYTAAIMEALETEGADLATLVATVDVATLRGKLRFVLRAARMGAAFRTGSPGTIVACFHPGLLPAAVVCAAAASVRRQQVRCFAYGRDIWGMGRSQQLALAISGVALITISDFSAGALVRIRPAAVLPPGLTAARYRRLCEVGARRPAPANTRPSPNPGATLRLLSVFRLSDFVDKGGPELLAAAERLRGGGCQATVTLAGTAPPGWAPPSHVPPWLALVPNPSDDELASLYATADVFVLASRLSSRPVAHGEGFGIVMAEAALSGLPVVAPTGGGSHAAFLDGITGLRPSDGSPEALAATLRWFADHPRSGFVLGTNGQRWAAERFNPDRYRSAVARAMLGSEPGPSPTLALHLAPDDGSIGLPTHSAIGTLADAP